MNKRKIAKLYATIYDVAFSVDVPVRPKLRIDAEGDGFAAAYFGPGVNGSPDQILIYKSEHGDYEDIADSIVHELVHAVQNNGNGGGRYGTHGAKFWNEFNERWRLLQEMWG